MNTFFTKIKHSIGKWAIVPRSMSTAIPGDYLVFKYTDGNSRVVLVTQPIVKRAGTGNLLVTGFKVGSSSYRMDALELYSLYTQGELDEGEYRTYNLKNIKGMIMRMRIKD